MSLAIFFHSSVNEIILSTPLHYYFLGVNYRLVWFIPKHSPSVESSCECGFNLEAVEGVPSGGPSRQIKRHPQERSAVWAFASESSQFPSPSLVLNNGVRVNREEEEGCGRPHHDLNSTRGGEESQSITHRGSNSVADPLSACMGSTAS